MSNKINPLSRLLELLPSDPLLVGDLTSMHADGTATVTMSGGGGVMRVRNPSALTGGRVFVRGGAVTGSAPALPVVAVEV